MLDFLTALLGEYSLWLMFISAFLSASLLPFSSEIVFMGLAAQIQLGQSQYMNLPIVQLWLVATVGNALGSLSTYWLGRLFPSPQLNDQQNPKVRWILQGFSRYGNWLLLLSWLPIVGDLICALAGWLRLNGYSAFVFMLIGKGLRYLFVLGLVIGYTFF